MIYIIPANHSAVYYETSFVWAPEKAIEEYRIADYNFISTRGGGRMNYAGQTRVYHEADAPRIEEKMKTDSFEEGLKMFENKRNLPKIKKKKELEDLMKIHQDELRVIGNTDITDELVKKQGEFIQGPTIKEVEIYGETIQFDIEYPAMAFPVCYMPDHRPSARSRNPERSQNPDATTAFRTLLPSRACTLRVTHNTEGGHVAVKKIKPEMAPVSMHIDSSCCLGSYEGTIIEMAAQQDYTGIANILADYICRFYEGSPFFVVSSPFWTRKSLIRTNLSNLLMWDKGPAAIRAKMDNGEYLEPTDLRGTLPQEMRDNVETVKEELANIEIPDWLTAKTGLSEIFQIVEVPIDFARSQEEGVIFEPKIERDWFNPDLFTFIN